MIDLVVNSEAFKAIRLTIELAAAATVILLILATPLAWWLSQTSSRWRAPVAALATLPLVLPPSVLGFYLLVAMGPQGPLGQLTQALGWGVLSFTFSGLLIGSVIFSLPFAVQPIQRALESISPEIREAAQVSGLSDWQIFRLIELPLAWRGVTSAAVMTFAHTLGEFGVILMVGGAIPGETKTVSIAIYDKVQGFDIAGAGLLSLLLLATSLIAIALSYGILGRRKTC